MCMCPILNFNKIIYQMTFTVEKKSKAVSSTILLTIHQHDVVRRSLKSVYMCPNLLFVEYKQQVPESIFLIVA